MSYLSAALVQLQVFLQLWHTDPFFSVVGAAYQTQLNESPWPENRVLNLETHARTCTCGHVHVRASSSSVCMRFLKVEVRGANLWPVPVFGACAEAHTADRKMTLSIQKCESCAPFSHGEFTLVVATVAVCLFLSTLHDWMGTDHILFLSAEHKARFLPQQRPTTTCEPSLRGSLRRRRKMRACVMRSPCSTCPRTVPSFKPRWLTICTRMTIRRNGELLVV